MAIIVANNRMHEDEIDEDEIDGFGSDDAESQLNPDIIQKVEDLLQGHEVPSVALTSEVDRELIFDSIRLLLNIENGVYFMYRRQFPESESLVKKPIIDCINEAAGDQVHDESFHQLLDLVLLRKRLLDFVDSWMLYLAPNLSAIVGTTVAAKLMATAGGLGSLAKMIPCNLQLLGFQKLFLDGLPTKLTLGYLQESEILQTFPLALTTGATLVLASKCTIAARFDFKEHDPSGNTGKHLREVVINKFRRYDKSLLPRLGVLNQSIPPGTSPQANSRGGEGPEGDRAELSRGPVRLQSGDWEIAGDYN